MARPLAKGTDLGWTKVRRDWVGPMAGGTVRPQGGPGGAGCCAVSMRPWLWLKAAAEASGVSVAEAVWVMTEDDLPNFGDCRKVGGAWAFRVAPGGGTNGIGGEDGVGAGPGESREPGKTGRKVCGPLRGGSGLPKSVG